MLLHQLRVFFVVFCFFPWGSDVTLVNEEPAFDWIKFQIPKCSISNFEISSSIFKHAICDVTIEIHGLGGYATVPAAHHLGKYFDFWSKVI